MAAREDKDRSAKRLIEHHGDSLLRLAGITGFRAWRAVQADLTHPRRLPDGLIEADFEDEAVALPVLIEIATYPERRVDEQVLRDLMLVYLERSELPEMITLVLRPRGNVTVAGERDLQSRRGLAQVRFRWRVVEFWQLLAKDLLAANEVGLIPWVPLTQFDEPPAELLQRCRDRIDERATERERENLFAVCQVMTRLRYDDAESLLAIFGGRQVMIESPLIKEIIDEVIEETEKRVAERAAQEAALAAQEAAQAAQEAALAAQQAALQAARQVTLDILHDRFTTVNEEIKSAVQAVTDVGVLNGLTRRAATCADLDVFRSQLPASNA